MCYLLLPNIRVDSRCCFPLHANTCHSFIISIPKYKGPWPLEHFSFSKKNKRNPWNYQEILNFKKKSIIFKNKDNILAQYQRTCFTWIFCNLQNVPNTHIHGAYNICRWGSRSTSFIVYYPWGIPSPNPTWIKVYTLKVNEKEKVSVEATSTTLSKLRHKIQNYE